MRGAPPAERAGQPPRRTPDERRADARRKKDREARGVRDLPSKRPTSLCVAALPGCAVDALGGKCCDACHEKARGHGGVAAYKTQVLRVPCR